MFCFGLRFSSKQIFFYAVKGKGQRDGVGVEMKEREKEEKGWRVKKKTHAKEMRVDPLVKLI